MNDIEIEEGLAHLDRIKAEHVSIEKGFAPPDDFTEDMLPPELSNWIKDVTDRIGTPFTAGVPITITMLGTLLGKKVCLRMAKNSGWFEYPNVWGMLVGSASKGKTPVAKQLRAGPTPLS